MNEIAIKRHDFDLAKNRLKEFSEKNEAELAIEKVRTEGDFFGLGDHKVTGDELNKRLAAIQWNFISVNTTNNKIIKEFREIYNALDALDRDYIASIIANVKAIEKTSNDVRRQQMTLEQHHDKLASQQNKLDTHQAEIEKNVANITKIVATLKAFKDKLESYYHLTDIDNIWNEIRVVSDSMTKLSQKTTDEINAANHKNQALSDRVKGDVCTLRNELKSLKEYFFNLAEKVESTASLLEDQMPALQKTAAFAEQVKNITHFGDVDIMWDQLEAAVAASAEQKALVDGLRQNLNALKDHAAQQKKAIAELEAFKACVSSMEHWMEVDDLWKQAEADQKRLGKIEQEHTERLTALAQADKQLLEGMASNTQDIAGLKEYREQLGGISHLEDVDHMWQDVAEHTERLTALTQVDKQLLEGVASNAQDIAGLKEYRDQLSGISHLEDVDRMWQNVAEHTERLAALTQMEDQLREGLSTNMQDITDLKKYRDQLSGISHLEDVDHMWQDIAEHTNQLVSGEQRDKALAAAIEQHKQDTEKKIAKTTETANAAVESLQKKVQYAYWIAGGSAGLAMIELILLLTKVI